MAEKWGCCKWSIFQAAFPDRFTPVILSRRIVLFDTHIYIELYRIYNIYIEYIYIAFTYDSNNMQVIDCNCTWPSNRDRPDRLAFYKEYRTSRLRAQQCVYTAHVHPTRGSGESCKVVPPSCLMDFNGLYILYIAYNNHHLSIYPFIHLAQVYLPYINSTALLVL
jgi:hypothetical protein